MKEVLVAPNLTTTIVDSPIPEPPTPHHVVIKVVVSGSNPKDWKLPEWRQKTHNSGDDIAGTVHKAGSAVEHLFVPGQRCVAFHEMTTPFGSFAEYAVAPAHTTMHIPSHTSFEEAASIPLAALTAAVGLFIRLGLPEPWTSGGANGKREDGQRPGPLIIYGAASAVGAYAIQLAKRAGIGPLICVAGRGIPFVEKMLDKTSGDAIVDYRNGDDAVVEGLKKAGRALPGSPKLMYGFDCVSEKTSYINLGKVLESGALLTTVLPVKDGMPEHVQSSMTLVGCVHDSQTDFGKAWFQVIEQGLMDGWFKGHPTEVIPGGLAGVETGLKNLKEGKASAVKYVFRIAETPKL